LDDNNDTTHKWSELSTFCPNTEIKLSAPTSLSYKYEFFKEMILPNRTEGLATQRPNRIVQSDNELDLSNFLETSSEEVYGDAITLFGTSFVSDDPFTIYYRVPIQNKGSTEWISPNRSNVEAGLYQPLSRRLYMNVLDTSLSDTGPFFSYGLNPAGIDRIVQLGFLPPPIQERATILERIGRDPPQLTAAPFMFTNVPVVAPTFDTNAPTKVPTKAPTKVPTKAPTKVPTNVPTKSPTKLPTKSPTNVPSPAPIRPPCGLLGWSIFCPFQKNFIFCGWIGRTLGLCHRRKQ
jgi:hypothetical protein